MWPGPVRWVRTIKLRRASAALECVAPALRPQQGPLSSFLAAGGSSRSAGLPASGLHMGYQHKVYEDIHFVQARLLRRRPGLRVVVFIDDLDRCAEDKVMDVLQAIHLLLRERGFYVLLGIDTVMIHRAIARRYRR